MNTTAHLAPRPARARVARRLGVVGLAGVLLLAACGDDDDDSADTTTAAADTTAAAADTTAAAADTTTPAADTTAAAADTTAPAADTTAAAGPATSAAAGDATVATAETGIGTVLVDANGMTLYAFLNDTAGEPTCAGDCAGAWPPATVEGEPVIGAGLDAAIFTVVEHPEAGPMLKAGDWPLYTFANDSAPGDTNGQGSGDVWFAVGPDGEPVE